MLKLKFQLIFKIKIQNRIIDSAGFLIIKQQFEMKNISIKIIMGISVFFAPSITHSCTTVKEYEKNKLNDAEMVLGNRTIEKTELSFQSYREGSSGANAGKVGGGCGCN